MTVLNVASILKEAAARRPEHTALVLGEQRVRYGALWAEARRFATVLRAHGVGPGDAVALLLPNVPDFPRAYFAALALGAVVVPVHALLGAQEICFVLKDSGAKVLVCAGPLLDSGAKGAALAGVPVLSVLDPSPEGVHLDALAAQAEPLAAMAPRDPMDAAVVLYTSGTTGKPKGAVLSHLNLVMNAQLTAHQVITLSGSDVLLGCLPLFHSFGQTCAMNAGFWAGATLVLMPRFDGAAALKLLCDQKVTVFLGVPTMYLALLQAASSDPRRPALRLAVSGGAALPLAVIEKFKAEFGAEIAEGYGLSETSPVATFNQAAFGRRAGTVGHPIWGVEVEIARADVDERIELLGVGELGELVIRGHNIMKGYLNQPEATAQAIVDGWFRSGDLGVKDAQGFISIRDRKKDMILRGGYNVYPREVEEVLSRHPAVAQVAVIGVPDDHYGEEVVAVVIRSPAAAERDPAELEREIITWSQGELAKYKYPRRVEFVSALPLGPSGKVLKREIAKSL